MAELVPFDPGEAADIARWAGDRESSMRWCSLPSVSADVVVAWSATPSVEAHVLRRDGVLVGYGELRVDDDDAEVELAHVIIAPADRGNGLGRRLATALAARAWQIHPTVALRVHPDNAVAIHAYRTAGFVSASPNETAAWNVGQPVAYVWMTIGDPEPTVIR